MSVSETPAAHFLEMGFLLPPYAKLSSWIMFLESYSLILTSCRCVFSFLQLGI